MQAGNFAFPIFGLAWKTAWETALQGSGRSPSRACPSPGPPAKKTLTSAERAAILALGDDLHQVSDA